MIFGSTPIANLDGAILAHTVRLASATLKKGRRLDAADAAAIAASGRSEVVAARLEVDDVHEDEAARRIGDALGACGLNRDPGLSIRAPFTGRVNLYADSAGLLDLDPALVNALNGVDESITLATLPHLAWVEPRQMVATVKIIPFAAPEGAVARCEAMARAVNMCIRAARVTRVGLIQTELAGTRTSVLDKTSGVLGNRVSRLGSDIVREDRGTHDAETVATLIERQLAHDCDLILIAGASAIVDRRDVIPAGIELAGGQVRHFGMPVDPGNLVLVGEVAGKPVVGLPGCARSPAFNGFDWVLRRLVTELGISSADLTSMGVGGLLKEGSGRPSPREGKSTETLMVAPRVAALVLAAGQSRRMGQENKLLAKLDGIPMLARTVARVQRAGLDELVVVTGHDAERVSGVLAGLEARTAHNRDYDAGLSTSLQIGLGALSDNIDAVVVCLGDMPRLSHEVIDALIAAYDPVEGRCICVPTWQGKRGNPVLFDRRFFPAMCSVKGDVGARHLLGENAELVCEVAVDNHAVLEDIDSPAELAVVRAQLESGEAG